MKIGTTIRAHRLQKGLSQGDIEKKTGLLRCYLSRVENGHTVLSIETLEKLACALEVPLYQLFYEGDEPPALPDPRKQKTDAEVLWGSRGERARMLGGLLRSLAHMDEADRRFLLLMAQKIASRRRPG